MDTLQIDARKWRFLENPARYIKRETGGLQVEPLRRQFRTAKEILSRLSDGRGVLLADDVGLGKTTVGALVAWVIACQDKRVRIYAPNDVLRRRWAEELERHVPMLNSVNLEAGYERIKQGDAAKLYPGRIQVATHHALVRSHGNSEQRTACDLMIIDEAHRAKGDGSAFNEALRNLGDRAKRKLILTATPLSIRLSELEQLLQFAGATKLDAIRRYAERLKRLYLLGDGHDVDEEAKQLVVAATAAIDDMRPYLIRHGIDDLPASERVHFGTVDHKQWSIPTAPASVDDVALLLRMDRLLKLTSRVGERRNDPRFHVGWQHFEATLDQIQNTNDLVDPASSKHIIAAAATLKTRRAKPHPKVSSVCAAVRSVIDAGEKILIFCHHRATANELLENLEQSLRMPAPSPAGPPRQIWRSAWQTLLLDANPSDDDILITPIIDWLCSHGLRRQVASWLGEPATSADALAAQLDRVRPRNVQFAGVPTIFQTAKALRDLLLDPQSTSTRALLKAIARGQKAFGGKLSSLPGRLDEGFRVMGAWQHDGRGQSPKTLYTGKPDIVLAMFNSPFGPDVLVTTDRLSEGVDLHRCCRHLIHYELDPSPVRTLQRNGRVRRVGSWASLSGRAICYAYPTFGGTRDEKAVNVMKQRINAFGLLLGGVPSLDDASVNTEQSFTEAVLRSARRDLESLNRRLCVR